MKVLHIAPSFPPAIGGVETFVADLASWQAASGVAVAVVAGTTDVGERDEHHNGLPVHRLPFVDTLGRRDLGSLVDLRHRLTAIADGYAPDLIHLHPVAAEMIFMRDLARTTRVPVVATLHVDIAWQPAIYRTNLLSLLARAHAVAAVSRPLLGDAIEAFPTQAQKLHLVENGLARQGRSEIEAEPAHFLYLGRLVTEKGVDIALRALARLSDRAPAVRLTIAGDGPDRAMLEDLAETLGLGGRVSFLGQIDRGHVPELMARHMALLVPSRWREPFGLVVLEAAMAGRPAIVSATGALPDLVVHGVTGLHVEPENPEVLANAMAHLAQAQEQAHRMGLAASARAVSDWSIARCGEAYQALYAQAARDVAHPRG